MLTLTNSEWLNILENEFKKDYFLKMISFLKEQEQKEIKFYPPKKDIFTALNLTPFSKVKVIILGQDPYLNENQAHGLSFSVEKGKIPPSLQNIYKALKIDFPDFEIPQHGNLSNWAKQGVLLLNSCLTVEAKKAGSHQNKGWEILTDKIISTLSNEKENLVFILWGKFAQQKQQLINPKKHLILTAPHPSPLSAHNGFFECKHFSKTNNYLIENKHSPIEW